MTTHTLCRLVWGQRAQGKDGAPCGRDQRILRSVALLSMVLVALVAGGVTDALAQTDAIVVSTNSRLPLIIGGVETEVPTRVNPGAEVCVPRGGRYVSESERWVFVRWQHGPQSECVTLNAPGQYLARFDREVLVQIQSAVPEVQRSLWLAVGVPVELDVPTVIDAGNQIRHVFVRWSGGETPFLPTTTFVPLKPTVLDVTWRREFLVKVEAPDAPALASSEWHAAGSSFTVQAPATIPGTGPAERLSFSRWESVGLPVAVVSKPESLEITVSANGPYRLRAVYSREFEVLVVNPSGVLKQDWAKSGDKVFVDSPPIIEVVPGRERLVFKRWDGIEGAFVPQLAGRVTSASVLRAVYDRQFMVTVDAPLGSAGGGWHTVGSTVTVRVPDKGQRKLVLETRFRQFAELGISKPSTQIVVQGPTNVTAIYTTGPDFKVLGLMAALPFALSVVYVIYRLVVLRWTGRSFRY